LFAAEIAGSSFPHKALGTVASFLFFLIILLLLNYSWAFPRSPTVLQNPCRNSWQLRAVVRCALSTVRNLGQACVICLQQENNKNQRGESLSAGSGCRSVEPLAGGLSVLHTAALESARRTPCERTRGLHEVKGLF